MLPSNLLKFQEETKLSRLLFGCGEDIIKEDEVVESEEESEDEEPKPKKQKQEHKSAWHDDDDEITVGYALDEQGRRLPDGGINARSSSYNKLLKHKYETIVGTPAWASLDRAATYDADDEILQSVGHIRESKTVMLQKGSLEFKKLKHLNSETGKEGTYIEVVKFHPKSTVALIAGNAGMVSLVTVDGKVNEKLHCVSFKKYPIKCGDFMPDGSTALLGSTYPYYYIYDLMNASTTRISLPEGITKMTQFKISSCGRYLAIVGRFGEVHFFCAKSRELIQTLKINGEIATIEFSHDNEKLFAHSSDGQVTVWDIKSLRVVHKWFDDGCISGSSLAASPSGEYFATGSKQGIVNLYKTKDVLTSKQPTPLKMFKNSKTDISGLKFNSKSEMLAFYSSSTPDALRIAHLPSYEVFSNFPTPQSEIGHCSTIDFSPNSGFMSFGTNRKTAFLYRLRHYENY